MSLNGLDSPEVQDAYQSATVEAGGWFLLKYTSRDSVDLLARGQNGVSEARNALTSYTEASPLYGLITYRRRKILIKYVPEGTSRVLQARTAVHLQDVLEKYSPYETLLDLSSGEGLNDTALAASFQLRTASASPSPSPSNARLDEIREDAEDAGSAADRSLEADTVAENVSTAPRQKIDRRAEHMKRKLERAEKASSFGSAKTPQMISQRPTSPASPLKQSVSQFLVRDESGHTSITPLESPFSANSTTGSLGNATTTNEHAVKELADEMTTASQQTSTDTSDTTGVSPSPKPTARRQPTAAVDLRDRELPALPTTASASVTDKSTRMDERPARSSSLTEEPYDFSQFDELFKPKVKLAPRPVYAPEKNKTTVARVPALPASFKSAAKKQEPTRPKSSGHELSAATRPPLPAPATSAPTQVRRPPPPVPETPEYISRPASRGSVKSLPSHRSHGMTPDKIRLMKAVEHRRKQLRKSQGELQARPVFSDDVPGVPEVPAMSDCIPSRTTKIKRDPPPEPEADQATDDESQPQSSKADSGIEIRYDKSEKNGNGHDSQSAVGASKPSTPEPGATGTSQAILIQASPTVARSSVAELEHDDAKAGASLEPPTDDVASTDSTAPTEKAGQSVVSHTVEQAVNVPTIVMADGSRPMTSDGHANVSRAAMQENPPLDTDASSEILQDELESSRLPNGDLAKRRRGFVEPLQVDINSGNPDDFASDDEFLDELHSATIVEAKPMTVSRSPMTPTFPGRRPSADTLASVRSVNITRTRSFPSERRSDALTPDSSRRTDLSASTPPNEKEDVATGFGRNVSSDISKRIQALAVYSRPHTPEVGPNSVTQRPIRPRPTSYRRHSSTRGSQPPTSGKIAENAPTWSVQHDAVTNRNSVSVTARIVRPNAVDENEADSGKDSLQHSEYIVNHRQDSTTDENRPAFINTTKAQSEVSSPALSPVLSRSSAEVRTLHSAGTSRFGRHKHQPSSPALDEFPPPPGARTASSTSLASNDENAAPKEGSRTSRFLKRMSNMPFGGTKSKLKGRAQSEHSTTSLTSFEDATTSAPSTTHTLQAHHNRVSSVTEKSSDTPPPVVVGDLNVQFPDSLLWKRRIVTIDESGHLQFAIAQAMEIHKGVALKRFPLTDFKQPRIPDLDMQELPYSVMLEFRDGTSLQAACEDAMTQRQVLHILKTYWKAWT